MSTLNALLSACQTEQEPLLAATRERVAQWDNLLAAAVRFIARWRRSRL